MALTLTFALKIAFLDFVAAGGIVSVSQTHLDISMVKKNQTEFRSELSVDTINPLLTTKQKQNVTCVEHASSVTEKVL